MAESSIYRQPTSAPSTRAGETVRGKEQNRLIKVSVCLSATVTSAVNSTVLVGSVGPARWVSSFCGYTRHFSPKVRESEGWGGFVAFWILKHLSERLKSITERLAPATFLQVSS